MKNKEQNLSNNISLDRSSNPKLQKSTIDTLQADAKKYAELNSQLQTKLVKANEYKNQLLSK